MTVTVSRGDSPFVVALRAAVHAASEAEQILSASGYAETKPLEIFLISELISLSKTDLQAAIGMWEDRITMEKRHVRD